MGVSWKRNFKLLLTVSCLAVLFFHLTISYISELVCYNNEWFIFLYFWNILPLSSIKNLLSLSWSPYEWIHEWYLYSTINDNILQISMLYKSLAFPTTLHPEFDKSLSDAKSCLLETVYLEKCVALPQLDEWCNLSDWQAAACDKETLAAVEGMLQSWCKRIELVRRRREMRGLPS